MTTPDLHALLAEVRELAEKATPGPWVAKAEGSIAKIVLPTAEFSEFSHHDPPNAAFIVALRNLWPRLLALAEGEPGPTFAEDSARAVQGFIERLSPTDRDTFNALVRIARGEDASPTEQDRARAEGIVPHIYNCDCGLVVGLHDPRCDKLRAALAQARGGNE